MDALPDCFRVRVVPFETVFAIISWMCFFTISSAIQNNIYDIGHTFYIGVVHQIPYGTSHILAFFNSNI